jgi:hypothetical protein
MMTYIFTINSVIFTCPKMLAHVISAIEKTYGLLDTLEVVFDWQTHFLFPRVFITRDMIFSRTLGHPIQ